MIGNLLWRVDIVSVKWSGGCGVLCAVFPVVVAYLFVRWVRRGTCGLVTFARGWIIPEHRSPATVALTTTAPMDLAMAAVMTLLSSFDYLIIRLFDSLILCLFVFSVGRWGDRTCRQCCGSTDTAASGEYFATSSSRAKIDSSLLVRPILFSSFLFHSFLATCLYGKRHLHPWVAFLADFHVPVLVITTPMCLPMPCFEFSWS